MKHWNYRIIRHKDDWYALHKVYYGESDSVEADNVEGWTEDPAFISDEPSDNEARRDISESLRMALDDALAHPILREEDIPKPEETST